MSVYPYIRQFSAAGEDKSTHSERHKNERCRGQGRFLPCQPGRGRLAGRLGAETSVPGPPPATPVIQPAFDEVARLGLGGSPPPVLASTRERQRNMGTESGFMPTYLPVCGGIQGVYRESRQHLPTRRWFSAAHFHLTWYENRSAARTVAAALMNTVQ